ncbi:MAG TPA: hypothetical protein VJP77_08100, partial [Planctomycetota bacterium]|nr:hypothetical protein [Planctomycetota bacterium]
SLAAEWALLLVGAVVALGFFGLGFRRYRQGPAPDERLATRAPALVGFLGDAWRVDRLYFEWVVQPVKLLAFLVSILVDQLVVDGLVNGSATLTRSAGSAVRRFSDGSLKTYALWMGSGAVVLALAWLLAVAP